MGSLRACLAALIFPLISSSFLPQIQGTPKVLKTQASALDWLHREKYFSKENGVVLDDSFLFEENEVQHFQLSGQSQGSKERDRIDRLPGQPPVKFRQYGGYVTVDEDSGRAFYYYFVEAEKKPLSAPLLLWLNGGPGCSSLAYGAMEELGPFRVNSDGKSLYKNNFAWNKVANVLFLESPAGVGFSYSNRTSDYTSYGDKKAATDNLIFLLNWLERFPEYKKRDFYISGESYAGHYVPQLAHNILQHNKKAEKNHAINLKGVTIGNAVMNDETDTKGMYEHFWTHALISDEVRNAIMKTCNFSMYASSLSDACQTASAAADLDTSYIDIYNIYAPNCHSSNLTAKPKRPGAEIDPCSDYYVIAYMNTPEVQKALHANVTKLSHDWQPCSDVLTKWSDSPFTILPLLREFMANGIRVWVFSGDIDGRVPVTSTRSSLASMKLKVKSKWYPWFIKGEVGGYTEVYEEGLTFLTVRGAGHQVPSFQPLRALSMIMHFLSGKPLPGPSKPQSD